MEITDFIGNRRIVDFFWRHARGNNVPSGTYVFVGAPQLGKKTLVQLVCAQLLKTSFDKLKNHPDFLFLERLTDEKTGKKKRAITVEQARDLKSRIMTSSWGAGQRFVLIDGADELNEEASNALLKLFEEPPARTVFFLTVQDERSLLPTIRSRAQIFHFSSVKTHDIEQALAAKAPPAEVKKIVSLSWGRPGRAWELLTSSELRTEEVEKQTKLTAVAGTAFYRQSKHIEEWLGKGEDTGYDRDEVDALFEAWIMDFHTQMVLPESDARRVWKAAQSIMRIQEARSLLRRQVNLRLVAEALALNFTAA